MSRDVLRTTGDCPTDWEERGLPQYAEIIIKSLFSFVALLAVCRLAGKKFDLVVPAVFGALAAVFTLDRTVAVTDGLVALLTWGVLTVLLGLVLANYKPADNAINGKPTVIMEGGKILEKNLRKSRLTVTDMMALLRQKGAFALGDVELAMLEPDGQVSVLMKTSLQPVSPRTAGIAIQDQPGPKIVVDDGQVMVQSLLDHGLSVGWLLQEIRKQGANDFDDVFLAQLDAMHNVYVDLKQDPNKRQPDDPNVKSRLLLLASLQKIQADYETFAIETQNQGAKSDYAQGSTALQKLIDDVQAQLRK